MKVQREIGQIQLKCFNKLRVLKKSTKMYVKLCGKKHWKSWWIINEAEERQTVLKCLAALSQAAAICSYHSFKIFRRFWLAKIPRITSYCRLNLEEFCNTELMTSIDRAAKLSDNCTINRENLGTSFSCFGSEYKMEEHLLRTIVYKNI